MNISQGKSKVNRFDSKSKSNDFDYLPLALSI